MKARMKELSEQEESTTAELFKLKERKAIREKAAEEGIDEKLVMEIEQKLDFMYDIFAKNKL